MLGRSDEHERKILRRVKSNISNEQHNEKLRTSETVKHFCEELISANLTFGFMLGNLRQEALSAQRGSSGLPSSARKLSLRGLVGVEIVKSALFQRLLVIRERSQKYTSENHWLPHAMWAWLGQPVSLEKKTREEKKNKILLLVLLTSIMKSRPDY